METVPRTHVEYDVTVCVSNSFSFQLNAVAGFLTGHSVVGEVSPDIHICGFCKQQYNNVEVFLAHKQNGCALPAADPSAINLSASFTGKA